MSPSSAVGMLRGQELPDSTATAINGVRTPNYRSPSLYGQQPQQGPLALPGIGELGTITRRPYEYNAGTAEVMNKGKTKVVDKDGKVSMQPLSEADLAKITSLVREAVGFSQARGDSLNVYAGDAVLLDGR